MGEKTPERVEGGEGVMGSEYAGNTLYTCVKVSKSK